MAKPLSEPNELLRSAYAIASRKGEDTNWEAFKDSLELILIEQNLLMNGSGDIEASTCTARVYKAVKE